MPVRCAMASSSFKIVSLGGGNASGYLARGLIGSSKLQRGDLAIITDEPVGLPPACIAMCEFADIPEHTGVSTPVLSRENRLQDTGWYIPALDALLGL